MILASYLSIGFGFYTGLALVRREMFDGAELVSITKGFVLGFILWPFGMFYLLITPDQESG